MTPVTTATPPSSRDQLPRGARSGQRNVKAGLLALLGSLVLVVGVPVGLVLAVGNPLPTEAPSRDWLTAEVTGALIIDVLAVLVWIVWAHFLVCFLAEWRAIRAGRMPGNVALGGGSQLLARKLVATLLLLAGGASVAQGLTALNADSAPTAQAPITQTVVSESAGEVEPVTVMTPEATPSVIKHYEVEPPDGRHYDTLWGIAERLLGDGFRYKELFELNKNRVQPDGRTLTDADLIRPGWQLRLPADAKGAGVTITALPEAPVASTPGPGGAETSAGSGEVGGTGVAGATTQVDAGGAGSDGIAELLLGSGLVLAGIVRALTARRGPFGEPDEALLALGAAAGVKRAEFIDLALRSLAEQRAAHDQPMPEVLFVYAGDDQLVLHLAGDTVAPEAPWTVSEDGRSWSLQAADLLKPGLGVAAPYPALVCVATTHGFDLLVDLEMAPGLVALGGHDGRARELVLSLATDLVTHAWSDGVDVVMVGFGDELADLDEGRTRHFSTLDQALADARRGQSAASTVARELGVQGVLQGRLRGAASTYTPQVIFLSGAPTSEQAQEIAALTSGGRTACSVVCLGDTPSARWRFVVDASGGFDAGVLGVTGQARGLSSRAQHEIAALVAEAVRRREAGADVVETTPVVALAEAVGVAVPAADETGRLPAIGDVRVRLLGPVAVDGDGAVEAARRDLLTEVVTMAALHADGVHEAVLRASIWPRGVDDDVMAARIADAQGWLGSSANGTRRLTFAEGRLQLDPSVTSDYALLSAAARDTGPGELDRLLHALRMGSGPVFSGVSYGWLAFAREARQARLLATSAARRASELAATAGRVDVAFEALELGIRLVPTAEPLWRARLRLAAQHRPDSVESEVSQMYSVLAEHGVRHEPETDALVTELAPRLGGAVGS